jgi:hypothetical protein
MEGRLEMEMDTVPINRNTQRRVAKEGGLRHSRADGQVCSLQDVSTFGSCLKAKYLTFLTSDLRFTKILQRSTRYRNWLTHYDTSRRVADSIPDSVIDFFKFI